MAIRYAGDVEIRCQHVSGDTYEVSVRYPTHLDGRKHTHRTAGRITCHTAKEPASPEAYDLVARAVVFSLLRKRKELPLEYSMKNRHAGKHGGPSFVVRRVFEAPCPTSDWKDVRRRVRLG